MRYHCIIIIDYAPLLYTGQLALSELAAMLDTSTLSQLRNEFGGLQTLLRNQSQVFQGTAPNHSLCIPTAPLTDYLVAIVCFTTLGNASLV